MTKKLKRRKLEIAVIQRLRKICFFAKNTIKRLLAITSNDQRE